MERFVFKTYEDRTMAGNELYDVFGGYVYREYTVYGDGYGLEILEECRDYEKAWRICRKHGGELSR